MLEEKDIKQMVLHGASLFLEHISVDCVIFGFHENELKVLLLKPKHMGQWALPGGFILKEEHVDRAAHRILRERTGLDDIFLQQFYLFGDPERSNHKFTTTPIDDMGFTIPKDGWLSKRFVTVGYYALVEYSRVNPQPDIMSESCAWFDLRQVPELIMDHSHILARALDTLRLQLNYQPIGYNLLPDKFTMPEFQKLYETILDRKLDRRNFQRRILGYGILRRLKERRKGGAHKAPYLYSFDLRKYHRALKNGLQGGW